MKSTKLEVLWKGGQTYGKVRLSFTSDKSHQAKRGKTSSSLVRKTEKTASMVLRTRKDKTGPDVLPKTSQALANLLSENKLGTTGTCICGLKSSRCSWCELQQEPLVWSVAVNPQCPFGFMISSPSAGRGEYYKTCLFLTRRINTHAHTNSENIT